MKYKENPAYLEVIPSGNAWTSSTWCELHALWLLFITCATGMEFEGPHHGKRSIFLPLINSAVFGRWLFPVITAKRWLLLFFLFSHLQLWDEGLSGSDGMPLIGPTKTKTTMLSEWGSVKHHTWIQGLYYHFLYKKPFYVKWSIKLISKKCGVMALHMCISPHECCRAVVNEYILIARADLE